jgi:hypothetical protein
VRRQEQGLPHLLEAEIIRLLLDNIFTAAEEVAA